MAIFLVGATGFIGGHILRALSAQGYEVTCLVRPASRCPTMARQPLEALPGVHIVEGEWTRPESWLASVAGNELVINAVGMIRQNHRASFAQVHTTSAIALFEAAAHLGSGATNSGCLPPA